MQARHAESNTLGRAPGAGKPRTAGRDSAKPAPKAAGTARQKPIEISIQVPGAQSVCVAGTFNDWDDKKTPLQKDGSGWKTTLPLSPGRYEYKFVVDGQWICDPNAKEAVQNDFGTSNSILVV